MLLVVADSADEPAYLPPLTGAGYVLRIREPDWFEHRLLKTVKRELAGRTWRHVQHYADAKSAVVAEIMERAGVTRRTA